MRKTKNLLPVTLSVVIVILLGMLLFACNSSSQQERQITNAFTPGKTRETILQPESSEDIPIQTKTAVIPPADQSEPTAVIPDQPTMVVTNTQGLPIIVTQTRAATQPNQPANTATPTKKPTTNTATATQKPSNTPTPTKTLTPTVTMQTGWEGEWKVFWQAQNQTYVEGMLTVEVAGTDFTAIAFLEGVNYTFTGRIIRDGETAFGNWTSPTSTGGFIWNDLGTGQFGGSRDNVFGFCGAREGVVPPNPCFIAPLM